MQCFEARMACRCPGLSTITINIDLIENRRVVGVDRFGLRMKRLRRFGPFADRDQLTDAGAQFVVHDQFLGRFARLAGQIRQATAAPPADTRPAQAADASDSASPFQ